MISEYTNPVQNSLEQYVPLPLEQIYKSAAAIQQRGDLAANQNDAVQTGLSSMEALAPGQRDFVNKFANDFRAQQGALLDKYHGNTSDVNYDQESRKLNMQFAADPRLTTIKQVNELIKKKQSIKDELDAKGLKYLDSNPSFTGVDGSGNLTSDVGSLKSTAFDSNINQAFKDKENAIEQIGHRLTNHRNLMKIHDSYVNQDGTLNTDNQDVQQGLAYYKQQGLTDMQAAAKVRNHVDAGLGYAHDLKDHFYEISPYQSEELSLRWAELKDKQAREKKEAQPELPNLLPFTHERAPLIETNVNQNKLNQLDNIKFKDNGGLNKDQFFMDDTPENRKKLDAKGQKYATHNDIDVDALGTEGGMTKKLIVEGGYNPNESKLVDEAREFLGPNAKNGKNFISDQHTIERYKATLSNQAQEMNYIKPNNSEYLKSLEDVQIGKKGENIGPQYTIFNSDGSLNDGSKQGSNPLENIKEGSFSYGGANPTPFGKYQNGTVKINATDKKGNPVEIIKPLDRYQQQVLSLPNQMYKALNSDVSNSDLEKTPITMPNGQMIYIQKGETADHKVGMKAYIMTDSGPKEVDVERIINDTMAGLYNSQEPYKKLK